MMQITKESAPISAAIISVPEAMALSNLAQDALMALVKDGSIKGRKIGTTMKVYRMSLMSYLSKIQKAEGASDRKGATSVEPQVDARDEIWDLKRALSESQQIIDIKQALFVAEQQTCIRLRQQLSEIEKNLSEALVQIEHMMLRQETRPQPIEVSTSQLAVHPNSMNEASPSFMHRVLGWLGLR